MKQVDPLPATIQELIPPAVEKLKTANSPTPLLDAQLWLAHICGLNRTQLLARPEHCLTPTQTTQFHHGLDRLAAGEPLPYLTGHTEFYGLCFQVTPATLIPRPETEHLIDAAIQHAKHFPLPVTIADVGTGSGCIAVTLAVQLPAAQIVAIDVSAAALKVAQQNASTHQVAGQITFRQGSLLEPLGGRAHLIAANLPYIADTEWDDLPVSVREHEPAGALRGGSAGLDLVEELLRQAPSKLDPGGIILLEIGATQGAASAELVHRHLPAAQVELRKDYAGRDRLVIIQTS